MEQIPWHKEQTKEISKLSDAGLIEYRNKYAETSGTLWLYHKDTVNDKEVPLINCKIILLISQ